MKICVYSEYKYRYKEFKLLEKFDYFILIIWYKIIFDCIY